MRSAEIRQEIGARLREERDRLALSQQAVADAIGGVRYSIVKYESGRSSPSAESLVALESIGFDVRYVLLGFRSAPAAVDRERFQAAFAEVQRQATRRREKLSVPESLDLAWRFYDAMLALTQQPSAALAR
ncbi:MAG: helix-turn-helix transcriptional regulator [Pseudorhodoferax sp.]